MPSKKVVCASSQAILFDLNDTLVRTSEIKLLRRSEEWVALRRSFQRTSLPAGTREFLSMLKKQCFLGVVTSAPRFYAEELLDYHALDLAVLSAGDEVERAKPDPEGLLKAAAALAVAPEHCIYVGDHPYDQRAAFAAGCGSITVTWELTTGCEPRGICCSWQEVAATIVARGGPQGRCLESARTAQPDVARYLVQPASVEGEWKKWKQLP